MTPGSLVRANLSMCPTAVVYLWNQPSTSRAWNAGDPGHPMQFGLLISDYLFSPGKVVLVLASDGYLGWCHDMLLCEVP